MGFKRSFTAAVLVFFLSFLFCGCLPVLFGQKITGRVLAEDGETPVVGALVSVRAEDIRTRTDPDGAFQLRCPAGSSDPEITAWAQGYYIASTHPELDQTEVTLVLRPLPAEDATSYAWIDPKPESSQDACGRCHPMILAQWEENAHGQAVHNTRFYSFYNAEDVDGNPLNASGYLVDFPGTAGNCAACHAPGAAVDAPFSTDMNRVRGEITAGIHCDFCHKTGGIYLDPANGLTYPNVPGVLAMALLRPPDGDQIFIGPYLDIHDPDTYSPQISESDFCATCHQFSYWGTEIYNSYGEWLDSSYSQRGITCQDCHMPPSGDEYFALQSQGGLSHPPETIPSHFQLGLKDEEFMQTSLEMEVRSRVDDGRLTVRVELINTGAGHHVPTDHPGRHLILIIKAVDQSGNPLTQLSGPVIPAWSGDEAGMPGTVYAKVLEDALTGQYPVVNYWNPTLIHNDNRIPADGGREEEFSFRMRGDTARLEVRVLFRRLFQPIADQYGWDLSEIILNEQTLLIQP